MKIYLATKLLKMSASSESSESKVESSPENSLNIDSRYALYLFSNNKHAPSPGSEHSASERGSSTSSKSDCEEPSVCLSLLEGNLNAEQETVVRCYLLNILSLREDLSFENGGKYAVLHFSEESNDSFGCYYHRLSKCSDSPGKEQSDDVLKRHTFFICLIGPANGVMESFCPELSTFCCSLTSLLDPEGLQNKEDVQNKLKTWYSHCVEYIGRCMKNFQEDIPLILLYSLWGNVEVIAHEEGTKWDLERFLETCSLMASNIEIEKETPSTSQEFISSLTLKVDDGKIYVEGKDLGTSSYCLKWFNKLKNCSYDDYRGLHSILEGFRLKTIQDLNTLRRLLQKAVNDHYSLYNTFLFLQASGCEDILLYHVRREAFVASETEVLDVITCLQSFLSDQHSNCINGIKS